MKYWTKSRQTLSRKNIKSSTSFSGVTSLVDSTPPACCIQCASPSQDFPAQHQLTLTNISQGSGILKHREVSSSNSDALSRLHTVAGYSLLGCHRLHSGRPLPILPGLSRQFQRETVEEDSMALQLLHPLFLSINITWRTLSSPAVVLGRTLLCLSHMILSFCLLLIPKGRKILCLFLSQVGSLAACGLSLSSSAEREALS